MGKQKYITNWSFDYNMASNGMFVGFNTPKALTPTEFKQGLPPYNKRKSFLVDEYPACPKDWMRSEGREASYFVPVKEGQGMWLDFNKNKEHTHDVAIIVSVQGVNPLTGLQCEDAYLEQYIDNCPKCETPFKPGRLCEKCDMKYPKQNYIATTGTPDGSLWLDGFRSVDGVVRQYILTQEKIKGVATNLIGSDRVYSIGVSFFLSKKKKYVAPLPPNDGFRGIVGGSFGSLGGSESEYSSPQFFSPVHTPINWQIPSKKGKKSKSSNHCYANYSSSSSSHSHSSNSSSVIASMDCSSDNDSDDLKCAPETNESEATFNFLSVKRGINEVSTKKLEVGAGANIEQKIHNDPETLDFWRDDPEAIIYINYALEDDVTNITAQGRKELSGNKEGFLEGIPVA